MNEVTLRAAHERNGWPSEPLFETHDFWVAHLPVGVLWAADTNVVLGILENNQ